jgi:hypothetical protein
MRRQNGQVAPVAATRVEEALGREMREDELADPLELPVDGRIRKRARFSVLKLCTALVELAQGVGGSRI